MSQVLVKLQHAPSMFRPPHALRAGVTQPAATTTTTTTAAAIRSGRVVWQGEEVTALDGEGRALPGLRAVA